MTPTMEEFHCSFCGKLKSEVEKLISGPRVFICEACVDLCVDIIAEERGEEREPRLEELRAKNQPLLDVARCYKALHGVSLWTGDSAEPLDPGALSAFPGVVFAAIGVADNLAAVCEDAVMRGAAVLGRVTTIAGNDAVALITTDGDLVFLAQREGSSDERA